MKQVQKNCEQCGDPFVCSSTVAGKAKYCPSCKYEVQQKRHSEQVNKKRRMK